MKLSNFDYRVGAALALAAAAEVVSPARAAAVLLGSDYFQTVPPTFFIMPPGLPNPPIPVKGVPSALGRLTPSCNARTTAF